MPPLLSIQDLHVQFRGRRTLARALEGVSYDVLPGETVCLVGESGCGKTVSALSVLGILPVPPAEITQGSILFEGRDLLRMDEAGLRNVRGNRIAMVFQEPMTSLNPVFTIGDQIGEAIRAHRDVEEDALRERCAALLRDVGIPSPEERLRDYPHQLSGGQRQRAMIAMALACNPALLVADEPTTALDVTIQAQILELMLEMKRRREEGAVMLITHDLAVVAETCERVIVMYGGAIQEVAAVGPLFEEPLHPYTQGLLASLPRPDRQRQKRLSTIRGMVPSILEMPTGCKYCTRCDKVFDRCYAEEPALRDMGGGHLVRCHLMEEGR